jgi:hypothetical protein
VESNATGLSVTLVGEPTDGRVPTPYLSSFRNDFDLQVMSPDGTIVIANPRPEPAAPGDLPTTEETYVVEYDNLTLGGIGDWEAVIAFKGPQSASYALSSAIYYNLSRATEMRVFGAEKLMPGETKALVFTINAKDADALQLLRYGGIAHAYHDHSEVGDQFDHGDYVKWNTFGMSVGSTLRYQNGEFDLSASSIDTLSPVFRRFSQVLGFAGSFLIIPSLVFGGTFGKGSVTLLNRAFGQPRRRVLFHNSLSFWLLGTSLLHMFLLFYETQWGWSHGLVWGGLALACMIGLGVTGATQRSFVAKWGFTRWRFVHFAMGVLVAIFVLVHLVADGTHLNAARDWFG